MSKIERSTGRKARKALEQIMLAGGSGTIVIGIAEDSKLAAVAGGAALGTWARLKLRNKQPEKAEKLYEVPADSQRVEGTVGAEGRFGTETSSETTAFDIQRSSLSQPAFSATEEEDKDSTDRADQEPEYPVGTSISERQDAAEYIEAIERFLGPSFDEDLADIRNEANLYHGNPAWDINVDTYNEARDALEELEHSGSLPQSTQDNIDAMQARLGFEDKDDETDESNEDDSDSDGDDGDSGDGGNGDGDGDGGDGGE